VDYVKANMQRGRDMTHVKPSDRPWNDPGPGRGGNEEEQFQNLRKPVLHAIVLDLSNCSHIDTTSVQALIDVRTEVEKWADHPVEFHFAPILTPWIRRALVAGGFGIGVLSSTVQREIAAVAPYREDASEYTFEGDVESGDVKKSRLGVDSPSVGYAPLVQIDTPFFHVDLAAAVNAAESGIGRSA